jgi:hypothetical protein
MKRSKTARFFLAILAGLWPAAAQADGIDLVPYFSRAPTNSIALALLAVALIMLANYGLNFLVIGLPACRFGKLEKKRVARSLVWLTLLGQVADRVGAVLAGFFAGVVASALRLEGEGSWLIPLLALNFAFSGLAIAALVFVFGRFVWSLSLGHSAALSVAAGILTNPAWAMGLWFLG